MFDSAVVAWGRAVRPVVLVYTAVGIAIPIAFRADVNAQAGTYARVILAMMVPGAVAVSICSVRRRQRAATVGFSVLAVGLLCALAETSGRSPTGSLFRPCSSPASSLSH